MTNTPLRSHIASLKISSFVALALLISFHAVPLQAGQAQVTVYTDRLSFEAATSARSVIDFSGLAPADGFVFIPNGTVIGDVTFSSTGAPSVVDAGFVPAFYDYGTGAVYFGGIGGNVSGPSTVTMVLPTSFKTTAFAVELGDVQPASPFSIQLIGPSSGPFTIPGGKTAAFGGTGLTFIGFTSDVAITSVQITENGVVPVYDNVTVGIKGLKGKRPPVHVEVLFIGDIGINTVTSVPPGINCNGPGGPNDPGCSFDFPGEAVVTLVAQPFQQGSATTFDGWGSGCQTLKAPHPVFCQVTSGNKPITADFRGLFGGGFQHNDLLVAVKGEGSVTGGCIFSDPGDPEIGCGPGQRGICAIAFFPPCPDVQLTPHPQPDWRFVGWSGPCVLNTVLGNNICNARTPTENMFIRAIFAPIE